MDIEQIPLAELIYLQIVLYKSHGQTLEVSSLHCSNEKPKASIGFVQQGSERRSKIRRIMSHLDISFDNKLRLIFLLALEGLIRYDYVFMCYVNQVVCDIFVENYMKNVRLVFSDFSS